ncbi:MAG: sigma-70 family RNA polymerase sigma factor [Pedobacter sp.]|nr:MAG: sigma-70 family RNA polymerase sigma factor [Pedobacter sp.]
MPDTKDNTLVLKLKNEDNASFEMLYKLYYPSIATYISKNSGNEQDTEDVFKETIIVLLKNIRKSDFNLTSSLKTYLFAIARNLWLKKLRDQRIITTDRFDEQTCLHEDFDLEVVQDRDEKVTSWIKKITENCQRILKAIFFFKEPMDSLMQKMGWKNKHTAANQQYKCIQQVKKVKRNESDLMQ